jgi:hypothetical protein
MLIGFPQGVVATVLKPDFLFVAHQQMEARDLTADIFPATNTAPESYIRPAGHGKLSCQSPGFARTMPCSVTPTLF